MRFDQSTKAFSLIEVVIAVGIFSFGITLVLGLFGSLQRDSSQARAARVGASLASSVVVQLQSRVSSSQLSGLAGALPVITTASDDGLLFVAAADGSDLRAFDAAESPRRDQFFLVEARKFGSGPLVFDPTRASLAVSIRVSWPYRPLGGTGVATPPEVRESLTFNTAVTK